MKMEIEIISKECIKPSSPRPHHPKNHKVSFLDLQFGHRCIPLVLHYPVNCSPSHIDHAVSKRLQLLKQSFSKALSHFYPFTGKTKDRDPIDCNDEVVYFVEAKVKCSLNQFFNHPNISLLSKFLPDKAEWKATPGDYIAAVQVIAFTCGGIAVGVYVSHMIADGTAFSSFLKGWASIAHKNSEEAICPKFDASSLFPYNEAHPKHICLSPLKPVWQVKLGRYITRRYVFDASAVAKLKAKATSSSAQNPTRVEVVTAFLAKSIMASFQARSESDKPFLLGYAVNLRRRAMPQFSEYYMGNILWLVHLLCKDKEVELEGFVCQQREATAKLNRDFVNSLQGDEGWLNYLEAVKVKREILNNPANLFGNIKLNTIKLKFKIF